MSFIKNLEAEVKRKLGNDPAHDFNHIMRVYKNAQKISKKEKANTKLVLAATLLHDVVSYPKSDPKNKTASLQSAKYAARILKKYDLSKNEIKIICDAIRDHSYSRNKIPETLVGKILQDADRLDAIGAIGIARTFSVSGRESKQFYNTDDPFCFKRTPRDDLWAVDHFYKKLFKLEKTMNTKSAKIEASRRTKILKNYLSELKKEI